MLEPLLPKGARAGLQPARPRRRLIDGIRFRVRTGVPWRDVPAEYGPWGRVCDLFRRWQRNGTWQRILTRLQSLADAEGAITWDPSVDSTVCRAHQHAAGARKQGVLQKEPPGGVFTEPGEHGLGRSRGGFTTKLRLAVEQGQKPMSIVITAGQRGDSPQFEPVLEKVRVPRIGPGRPRVRPQPACASSRRRQARRCAASPSAPAPPHRWAVVGETWKRSAARRSRQAADVRLRWCRVSVAGAALDLGREDAELPPESCGEMPPGAVVKSSMKARPKPKPLRRMPGSRWVA